MSYFFLSTQSAVFGVDLINFDLNNSTQNLEPYSTLLCTIDVTNLPYFLALFHTFPHLFRSFSHIFSYNFICSHSFSLFNILFGLPPISEHFLTLFINFCKHFIATNNLCSIKFATNARKQIQLVVFF